MYKFLSLTNKIFSFPSSSVPPAANPPSAQDLWNKVISAYQKGDFKPYEHLLKTQASSWGPSRLDIIKAKEKEATTNNANACEPLLYLFTLAIESQATNEEKFENISAFFNSLDSKEQENVIYQLPEEDGEFSLVILKYCKKEIREKVYLRCVKNDVFFTQEKFFLNVSTVITNNLWTPFEKQAYLDEMFTLLPSHMGDDVIYYLLKETTEKEQENFLLVCSPELSARIKNLRSAVFDYLQSKLRQIKSPHAQEKCTSEHIDSSFQKNKHKFYLDILYRHLPNEVDADLLVLELDSADWKYFSNKLTHSPNSYSAVEHFLPIAMNCLIKMSQRLKTDIGFISKMQKNDSKFWLFYHSASRFIEENKKWQYTPDYTRFGMEQNPLLLPRLFDAFAKAFQPAIIKHCVQKEPQNLLIWIDTILLSQKDPTERPADKLNTIFDCIVSSAQTDPALHILYNLGTKNIYSGNYARELAIYTAVDANYQEKILKHILQDKDNGLDHLAAWVRNVIHTEKTQQGIFITNFYQNLKNIDPAYPTMVKEFLSSSVLDAEQFIDALLPIDSEQLSPKEKQKRGIEVLKQHFMTADFPHKEREKFIHTLEEDLFLETEDSLDLLEKLVKEIPQEACPLIFLHLGHAWMYRKRKKELPLPQWFTEVCAITLTKMLNNQLLQNTQDGNEEDMTYLAMQQLYSVACTREVLPAMIQHFIQIVPVDQFIPIMEQFSHNCFSRNKNEFAQLLADAFANANMNKVDFIAKSLLAYYQSEETHADFGSSLVESPIAANDGETAAIGKTLIENLGGQYLSLFFRTDSLNYTIIKALNKTDPASCEQLLFDLLSILRDVSNKSEDKLTIFQNIMAVYASAGYDLSQVLNHQNMLPLIPSITTWYEETKITEKTNMSLSSFELLRAFQPAAFYPTVVNELRNNCDPDYPSLFTIDGMFTFLTKLGCKEEFLSELVQNNPAVFEMLKNILKKNLGKVLSEHFENLDDLALLWIPDWKECLLAWIKENIKKEKQTSYKAKCEPAFPEIVDMYQVLDKAGVLDQWLAEINKELDPELQKDLNIVFTKFNQKMKIM